MTPRLRRLALVIVGIALGAGLAVMLRPAAPQVTSKAALPRVQGTSAAEMETTLAIVRQRLADDPADVAAATRAAQVLLRKARVERSGGPALEAERILTAALKSEPSDYSMLKLLAATYLSQHRFREAITIAERGLAVKPDDAWHYGVIGDAHLELGERELAYAAFDKMVQLRPDAGAYSRVSYALELQGNLPRALQVMQMATEATSADDAEGLAWQHVHLANLQAKMGQAAKAREEYGRALFAFPGYPDAVDGLARLN